MTLCDRETLGYVLTTMVGVVAGMFLEGLNDSRKEPTAIYQTTIDGKNYLTVENGFNQRFAFAQASPHLDLWTRIESQTEYQISQTRSNRDELVQKVLGQEAGK